MHAAGWWLGLAEHSSTERVNRCSVALTKQRGSDSLKVGQDSGDLLTEPEEEEQDEDGVKDMQGV